MTYYSCHGNTAASDCLQIDKKQTNKQNKQTKHSIREVHRTIHNKHTQKVQILSLIIEQQLAHADIHF